MLTKVTVRNFKRFDEVVIELGQAVVLIGPNNSGKTAALQALTLWDIGVKRWAERRGIDEPVPQRRSGVTINRRDLIALPVPSANLLWRNLHVRDVQRVSGKQKTSNVRVDITVEGITEGKSWRCGMEFDYANAESIYCRPMYDAMSETPTRMLVPSEAVAVQIAFLPPMSGLAANETRLDSGAINVRMGEGRTAEVLRNLCYLLVEEERHQGQWDLLKDDISRLFGVELSSPEYIQERGEITMTYRDVSGVILDLSSSGRGLQQTLLLLAHLYANPGAVLLLDEPDAHLEILRQRQTYQLITEAARRQEGQIIAASHSEVVLNEAAGRDLVIAFVGKPHRIDDRGSQIAKALRDIGFEDYYQAEHKGWVLYLEGSSDREILRAFARILGHSAAEYLEQPFVHYIGSNDPQKARDHFYGLKAAKDDLVGILIIDHIERDLQGNSSFVEMMWEWREIENYLSAPETLLSYAEKYGVNDQPGTLFAYAEGQNRRAIMDECIRDHVTPAALRDRSDFWWHTVKASDQFLDPVFRCFYGKLGLYNLMDKAAFYHLAEYTSRESIPDEVIKKLDAIVQVASRAKPVVE